MQKCPPQDHPNTTHSEANHPASRTICGQAKATKSNFWVLRWGYILGRRALSLIFRSLALKEGPPTFALGVCSGPKGLVIDFPIFGFGSTNPCVVRGRLKSSRVGAAQPLASWRTPLGSSGPLSGESLSNPCAFGGRLKS